MDKLIKELEELKIEQKRLENEKNIFDIVYCTIEELSEVTKVLTKFLRQSKKFSIENLTEEIAHAQLMLDVTKNVFEINYEDILKEKLLALKKALI